MGFGVGCCHVDGGGPTSAVPMAPPIMKRGGIGAVVVLGASLLYLPPVSQGRGMYSRSLTAGPLISTHGAGVMGTLAFGG